MKAGNCDDVAWNWPYAPPKALHPWWCSNFLALLLSSFTLKNLPALATSFFPPREKKQRLFLLSVLFLLFWVFFSPPLLEAPNFSVIPKTNSASLWSPGLSYYLPHTHPNFFPPLFLSILLQFLASSRSKFSIQNKTTVHEILPTCKYNLSPNVDWIGTSECEIGNSRPTDRPTNLSLSRSCSGAEEASRLWRLAGWLAS